MPSELIPLTPDTAAIAPGELVQLTDSAVALVESITTVTDETVVETKEIMQEIGELRKQIDKRREEVKAPYLAACKLIDEGARPLLKRLDTCVSQVKSLLASYAMDVERRRLLAAAEQARLEAAARAESADTGQTPRIVTEVAIPAAAPISTRTDYSVKIVDESLIPRKYLRVDAVAILADLRGGTPVPGCELNVTRSVVNR